jgi:IstB-like ATP binding protein
MYLDATFGQPPCEPEPVPPCLKGECDPVNWPARLFRLRSPALDQPDQCCRISIQLLQGAALKAGNHSGDQPAGLAHLHDHKQRASLVKDGERAAEVIDFGHGCGSIGLLRRRWCLTSPPPHSFCRDNRSVLYQRVPKLFADLALARGDGRYARIMRSLNGVQLLILDDWGLEPLGPEHRHDMLEIVEDRYGRGATLITSQIPVDKWHQLIGQPTLADAILDRLVHNAHRLPMTGESMRKLSAKKRVLDDAPKA